MLAPMRVTTALLSTTVSAALLVSPARPAAAQAAAPAAEAVVPAKAVSLFNGKDLAGWTADVPKKDQDPNAPASFVVRNGMLVSLG